MHPPAKRPLVRQPPPPARLRGRRAAPPRSKWVYWLACYGLAGFGTLLSPRASAGSEHDNPPPQPAQVALEALSRLKGIDLETHPAVRQAVQRLLEQVRGRPEFVQLVRDFNLPNQEKALVQLAIDHAQDSAGVDAARLLVERQAWRELRAALAGSDAASATRLAEALGNLGDPHAVPLLLPLVQDAHADAALRNAAVRALANTHEGARELLALAQQDKLSAALKLVAAMALNHARWPDLQAAARGLLPLPESRDAEPLPPVSELARRRGDPARGREVFHRESVACDKCHQVHGRGVDFGPNLSEIGAKLAREALYEAILDPSAGISFGYEGWDLELKDGNEVFGLIVSETAEDLTLKTPTGHLTRYRQSEIVRRRRQAGSPMPAGLAAALSVQDLVDLVEYLASLKPQ